ncbi:NmrA family NAD(P)-binding protein [Pedobacter cryoconitis]|uniref:Uncharacterized protein YbjT (DUF2867 family) n=1 Tax=Pedobacter cryoconitis TaxID=188932 RepID=A0A7X0MHZ1_9SPHI|nr:NmrA family NAD(P)-binding protein [Pedobacter cryoconitis]MBB6499832.1 uncharacterized protein YbjT (DUF2867 family) [Pedobacter cryoconitis]
MTKSGNITVFGATGNIGIELLHHLSKAQLSTVAVTRDINKAKPMDNVRWIEADITDQASLQNVLKHGGTVFLLSGHGPAFVQQQKNVIEVAAAYGVHHLVKLSSGAVAQDSPFYIPDSFIGKAHGEVEQFLKSSGLNWTILQPNAFMQNWLGDLAVTVKQEHKIYEATAEGKRAYIDLRDISEVAFKVLTEPEKHAGKTYLLTGQEAVNFYDVAEIISEVTGKETGFTALSIAGARERLEKKGLPLIAIQSILAYAEAQREGKTAYVSDAVSTILKRPARSVQSFVEDHLAYFR